MTWVESGGLQFDLGHTVVNAHAGTCVVLPPDVENTPRVRAASVHQFWLPPSYLEDAAGALGPKAKVPEEVKVFGADARLTSLIRLIVQERQSGLSSTDPELRALTEALTYGLVRDGFPAGGRRRPDRRIERALEFITARYADPLCLDDLAGAAGLCRFSFLRAFRASVGESPYRYLTTFRLDRAAELLRGSEHGSVLEIALACGFGDPGRFARAFRARYGCTPSQYRLR